MFQPEEIPKELDSLMHQTNAFLMETFVICWGENLSLLGTVYKLRSRGLGGINSSKSGKIDYCLRYTWFLDFKDRTWKFLRKVRCIGFLI